jgi:outer membrane protein assembly factor BamB
MPLPWCAADWPQWRGPLRDGHAADFVSPQTWPKELRKAWQVSAGEGHSSPVVAAGQVFVHTRQEDVEHVRSLDLTTGKVVWQDRYAATGSVHAAAASHGLGPKSTPTVHQGRVYTLGIGSILSCYDAKTGRALWRKDFQDQFPQPAPSCGTSMSPLVVDGLCIVHVGLDRKGALLAFDAATGQPRWSYDGDGPGYSSPILAGVRGQPQLVTLVSQAVAGFSVADGRLLWRMPFRTTNTQNIVTPVATKDTIIVGGIGQPLLALRSSKEPEQDAEIVWSNSEVPQRGSS